MTILFSNFLSSFSNHRFVSTSTSTSTSTIKSDKISTTHTSNYAFSYLVFILASIGSKGFYFVGQSLNYIPKIGASFGRIVIFIGMSSSIPAELLNFIPYTLGLKLEPGKLYYMSFELFWKTLIMDSSIMANCLFFSNMDFKTMQSEMKKKGIFISGGPSKSRHLISNLEIQFVRLLLELGLYI